MTPNEKAEELYGKFFKYAYLTAAIDEDFEPVDCDEPGNENAKRCALICVDEILAAHFMKRDSGYKTFWLNVKAEIIKL